MDEPQFSTAHLSEIPTLSTGDVAWKPIRRHLGITAFGINAFVAEAAGEDVIEEHDELGAMAGHHKELYFVATGAARFVVGGAEIEAPAGTFVFVSDPAARRSAGSTAPNTTIMVMGAPEEGGFTPSEWEFNFVAEPAARDGNFTQAMDVIHEGLELHPNGASLLYNLACYKTLSGDYDEAVAHLTAALQLDPGNAKWAATDSDLDAIRDRPDFPKL